MEVSEVKRRLSETIERAKRGAAERRVRSDEAARDYEVFLAGIAIPLVRQVANALKVQGFPFEVFTPGGSVRLMSEKSSDDYIELSLDTSGGEPAIIGRSRHARGRRVLETEQPIAAGPIRNLTEDQVLAFLLKELEPFVEK
jgi:hypothetical protein